MIELARKESATVVSAVPFTFDLLARGVAAGLSCRCIIEVESAPGGTSPTLDWAVAWSSNKQQFAAGATASLTQQTDVGMVGNVLTLEGRYLRLTPTVAGTAPTAAVVETTPGVAEVASQGTLTLDTQPTGAVKSAGSLTIDTKPTGAVRSQGTLTMDTKPTGEVSAQATLTMTSQPTNGDTITIDGRVYTWQDTLTDVDGNIFTGGTEAQAKLNLIAAMDLSGVAGTDYALSMTPHATVSAAAFIGDDAIFTVITPGTAGNSVVSTETFTDPTSVWDAATFGTTTAGVDGDTYTIGSKVYTFQTTLTDVDGNVAIGADLAASKLNLVAAIDLSGTPGTDYATSMTAHTTVSVAAFIADDAVITALLPGTGGDAIATTETFAAGTNVFDAATLGTTTAGVAGDTMTVDAKVYTFVEPGEFSVPAVDGEISSGADLAGAQSNIEEVFDLSGTAGTDYSTAMTAHTTVDIAAFAANVAVLTAKVAGVAGDSIVSTETFTAGTNVFDAATLGTTVAGVAGDTMTVDARVYVFVATAGDLEVGGDDEINIGADLAASKVNLVAAFDDSGTSGTDYSDSITTHATVSTAAFVADDAIFTAVTAGAAGNSIVTTETFAAGTNVFDAATLGTTTAGVDAVGEVSTVDRGNASGGTWTMTVDGQTTAALAWDITAAALKTAVELLSTVSTLVSVTGTGVPTTDPWILTHAAADEVQIVTVSGALLTQVASFPAVTISVIS